MRLTVIVPMYNRERYIRATLRSLMRQRADCELDLLVIDDGSTDGGPARVAEIAERDGAVRMIRTDNHGVARARNVGLAHVAADAEFVTFLDSDDLSPGRRLADDLAAFREDPSLQFVYGKMTLADALNDERCEPAAGARQVTVRGVSMSAGIYRREFVRDVGPFDESFEQAEDTDWLFRAFESNAPFRLTETIGVLYRRHAGNRTRQHDVTRKCFLRALQKSLVRRRRDPSRGLPSRVFDMKPLLDTPME